jgi:hypothetical protein
MLRQTSLLVSLVRLIDHLPWPSAPVQRPRGRPKTYADRLILKALVMMMIRRLYTADALRTYLEQEDTGVRQLRPLLDEHGRFPTRRTWERRLTALPQHLPGLIGGFGRHRVALRTPWTSHGRAAAVDRPALNTSGGVWHQQHKAPGEMPQTAIDTEAGWSKSGWPGWWYGWQRHLAVSVGSVWLPLAADLPPAHVAAHPVAPRLWAPLPAAVRDVLGDTHDHDPAVRQPCEQSNRALVATRRGAYPHHDDGVEVRRIFPTLRSQALEPCNGLLKNMCEWRTQLPVKGVPRSPLLALGAIVIDQLVWLYQHEQHLTPGKGMKPLFRAA